MINKKFISLQWLPAFRINRELPLYLSPQLLKVLLLGTGRRLKLSLRNHALWLTGPSPLLFFLLTLVEIIPILVGDQVLLVDSVEHICFVIATKEWDRVVGIRAARLVDGFPMLRKAATEPLGGLVCALEI